MKGSEKSSYPRAMKLRKPMSSKSTGSGKGYTIPKDTKNSTIHGGDENVSSNAKGKGSVEYSDKSKSTSKMKKASKDMATSGV
eukprot:scaffold11079_cov92-Amphora_coffeaeformis.AAC.2